MLPLVANGSGEGVPGCTPCPRGSQGQRDARGASRHPRSSPSSVIILSSSEPLRNAAKDFPPQQELAFLSSRGAGHANLPLPES